MLQYITLHYIALYNNIIIFYNYCNVIIFPPHLTILGHRFGRAEISMQNGLFFPLLPPLPPPHFHPYPIDWVSFLYAGHEWTCELRGRIPQRLWAERVELPPLHTTWVHRFWGEKVQFRGQKGCREVSLPIFCGFWEVWMSRNAKTGLKSLRREGLGEKRENGRVWKWGIGMRFKRRGFGVGKREK